MNSSWLTLPITRLIASAASWFVFLTCFTLLFQVALVIIALGGSCASGGPYVVAVECPRHVALAAPLSILGGFVAVGISFLTGGFGLPLESWAWSILFGGLSIPFAIGGSWIVAVLFAVMGVVPLVWELRANVVRSVIGSRTVTGQVFLFRDNSRRSILSMRAPQEGEIVPTFGHALLGLAVPLAAGTLGVATGLALF